MWDAKKTEWMKYSGITMINFFRVMKHIPKTNINLNKGVISATQNFNMKNNTICVSHAHHNQYTTTSQL